LTEQAGTTPKLARPLSLALAFVAALSAGACSRSSTLDKERLARLLGAYLTEHCDVETVTLRASRLGTDAILADEATFATKVVADPNFQSVPGPSSSYGKSGSLSFQENGQTLHVAWNEFSPPDAEDRDRLTIHTCLYVPGRIEITDESPDDKDKSANVVFHETYRLSRIGQSLSALGLLHGYEQFSTESGYTFLAHLRSDGESAWRVDFVRLV
jgi:hypothetical protein